MSLSVLDMRLRRFWRRLQARFWYARWTVGAWLRLNPSPEEVLRSAPPRGTPGVFYLSRENKLLVLRAQRVESIYGPWERCAERDAEAIP